MAAEPSHPCRMRPRRPSVVVAARRQRGPCTLQQALRDAKATRAKAMQDAKDADPTDPPSKTDQYLASQGWV